MPNPILPLRALGALALAAAAPLAAVELPETARSFELARQQLIQLVYASRRQTPLCGCRFDERGAISGCDDAPGAPRLAVEPVYPPARFNAGRACWREPERFPGCLDGDDVLDPGSCCARVDPVIGSAAHDLVNLWPTPVPLALPDGYRWGEVGNGRVEQCGIRSDDAARIRTPPDALRGDLARVMLYMEQMYGFPLDEVERETFTRWHRADPPDADERARNRAAKRLQERANALLD